MRFHDQAATPFLGGSFTRIDGALKVSGGASYTSDKVFPGMLYAVPVCATIASGKVTRINVSSVAGMRGVHTVFTRENIGQFFRVAGGRDAIIDEKRPPFDDDVIRYYGQYVALVVADTFENATAAADVIAVEYAAQTPDVSMHLSAEMPPAVDAHRGDAEAAFANTPDGLRIDETYTTPIETHNPIELNATVAIYDGTSFTLYETSQAIVNHKSVMVQMLGVAPENVRVITEYLGSGFGGKLWPWTHSLLAAAAARNLRRPIKLVISRKMMFHGVGHRSNTQQRLRLSATTEGRLTSIQHDFLHHAARTEMKKESCGGMTRALYSTPNLRVGWSYARRDIAPNTSMRGPGAVPGLFALESSMDELAVKLNIDPVALRLLNEPVIDEDLKLPFSSRHLAECLTSGASKFGWSARSPKVGSMCRGDLVVGWGVAACTWGADRRPAEASVLLNADGTARVASATQDIGTGTYTVLAQMVAHETGLPVERIHVAIGDTVFPPGPFSGGSGATGSLVPAVVGAAGSAIRRVLEIASRTEHSPFHGQSIDSLAFRDGMVHRKTMPSGTGVPFARILQMAKVGSVSGSGRADGSVEGPGATVSMHSYGAHFVEVTWQASTARLRVSRVVTVIDGGQIINSRTARNQIEGAIIMGIGMALFEETHYDAASGAPINSNLADYVMTTNADAPKIDVSFLDYPDLALNAFGARGIGEIGLAGFAPAVTAAVYHATGVRVRDLPVKIEDLLTSPV